MELAIYMFLQWLSSENSQKNMRKMRSLLSGILQIVEK